MGDTSLEGSSTVEIANIVASGKFDVELDLAAVAEDLRELTEWIESVEHSRRKGNRLLIEFQGGEETPLAILAPTGVFVLTGADTYEDVEDAEEKLYRSLAELGIISSPTPDESEYVDPFEMQNIVCTAEIDESLNLDAIAIGLGLERTEYEPEQFPGLIFRPDSTSCTILVFATGKVVITGVTDEETAEEEFEALLEKLGSIL